MNNDYAISRVNFDFQGSQILHVVKNMLKNGNPEMKNIFFSYLMNIKLNWLVFVEDYLRNPQLNFSVLIHCKNIGFLRRKDMISKTLPKYR